MQVPADAPADLLDRLVRSALRGTSAAITLNPRKVAEDALGSFSENRWARSSQ